MTSLRKTLAAPKRPAGLPQHAKWLAGEGAGSWFVIEWANPGFKVSRYSPTGDFECGGTFITDQVFNQDEDFEITYPSHCAKVTLVQARNTISLLPTL